MVKYFIKLKPLNPFYFGSIKSFDDNKKDKGSKKPYFLKGNIFPQQTAVLGMLRKKILEDNGILIENSKRNKEQREKEKGYIGEIKSDFSQSSFGKIESISSIQIFIDRKPYFYYEDSKEEVKFSEKGNLTNKNGIKKLLKYNPKNFEEYFKSFSTGERKNKSDIFEEILEYGIDKQKKEGEDNSLFQKQRYVFKEKNICFGFYVTLNDVELKNGFIQLGDKYSIFYLEVEILAEDKKIENEEISKIYENEKNDLIFFLSDTYVEQEDLKKILEKSEGMSIKNSKFKFTDNTYNRFEVKKESQNLIKRGSIFIKNNEIIEILGNEKYENYKKVGFNDYKIVKGAI